uniref:Sodium/calcium exchanger membrane region domain-containing protein n=1 Tax=Aegilops tauschii subsp. strangulata TaxID=200361 RepID=A0A453H0X2_AEGTS
SACFLLLLPLLLLVPTLSPSAVPILRHVVQRAALSSPFFAARPRGDCQELQALDGAEARCAYLLSHTPCAPAGYVDYLRLFYCGFAGAGHPAAGYAASLLWLVVLFYLLGDTASEYFCASLEGLSAALRLPPAVAGVTLLSLGNGAPDVFASVVSFAAGDGGDGGGVGLNSALGGALFVSTVVAGVVALAAGSRGGAVVELRGFVRDLCFLFFALCYLVGVLVSGTVNVWVAASFVSIYVAYVVLVWTSQCCADPGKPPHADLAAPLLLDDDDDVPPLPSYSSKTAPGSTTAAVCLHYLLCALRMPLYLPRRLTIPDIAAHRWSRPCAVASAALAPVLLATTRRPRDPPLRRSPRAPVGRPRRGHHGRQLPPARPPAPRAVACRRVPDERALGIHPGARAGGAPGGDRVHGGREGERAGRDGAGVGGLARRPGLQRGDGDARRPGRRADGGLRLLRRAAVQHGGGAGAVTHAGGGRAVPGAVHAAGRHRRLRDGGVPVRGAGVGAGGGAGEGHAAGPGVRGGPHRHLPRLLRRPRPRQPRPLVRVARSRA